MSGVIQRSASDERPLAPERGSSSEKVGPVPAAVRVFTGWDPTGPSSRRTRDSGVGKVKGVSYTCDLPERVLG